MRGAFLLLALLCCAPELSAQDPFEIQIIEYELLSWRDYSLEAHLNFVTQGTAQRDGNLLPTEHQTHLTLEPTFGLSQNFAWIHVSQRVGTGLFASIRRLACVAPRICASFMAPASSSWLRSGILFSNNPL